LKAEEKAEDLTVAVKFTARMAREMVAEVDITKEMVIVEANTAVITDTTAEEATT